MEDRNEKNHCMGCLCSFNDYRKHEYRIQFAPLKAIFDMLTLNLCYICKRLAEHTELFIQNVQSNQILMENFHMEMTSMLETVRSQIQSPISLTHVSDTISLTVTDIGQSEVIDVDKDIKQEMKEEAVLDHLEGEFIEDILDEDYSYIKEDDFPLKAFIKQEKLKADDITIKSLKKKKAKNQERINNNKPKITSKRRIKIEGTVSGNKPKIEKLYITKKQCLEERQKWAKNQRFLNYVYKCKHCLKGFSFKASYELHMSKHSEIMGKYECDICKLRMNTEDKLLRHKKYHKMYRCGDCGLVRVSRESIKDHHSAHHCNDVRQYACPHCPKAFKRQMSQRKHIRYTHTHRQRVTCEYCNKTYADNDVLKSHMMIKHPIEVSGQPVSKEFSCEECGKYFRSPSHLKLHSVTHSDDRNYYCVECDKSFKSETIFKQHLKTAQPHINYSELPLSCAHCEKRFAIKRDLERHMNRVHLNIKPFRCDQCDKSYVNSWSLLDHKKYSHEGQKRPLKYPCEMCDKVFDRSCILKSHIRTHTGERPYGCSTCGAHFTQPGVLATHVRLVHLRLTRDGRPKPINK